MTSKKILKFYFRAEELNRAVDRLIVRTACASAGGGYGGEHYAERIIALIGAKKKLGCLWAYLNGVMSSFGEEDKLILRGYALGSRGYSGLVREEANAIRRVVVRFMRRAKYLSRHGEGVELIDKYYAFLGGKRK